MSEEVAGNRDIWKDPERRKRMEKRKRPYLLMDHIVSQSLHLGEI